MATKIEDVLDQLRVEFSARLERKSESRDLSGWNKEQIKIEFERALSDALLKFADIY